MRFWANDGRISWWTNRPDAATAERKKKEEVTLGQILERRSGWGKRENMILTERGSLALALDLAKRFPPINCIITQIMRKM